MMFMNSQIMEDRAEYAPVRLLLCDDSALERLPLAHFLRRCGYAVAEAEDGKAGIEHLKHGEYNAILLDLHMPNSDGFDVLKYLQEHRKGMPVILLSGMAADDIQHEIRRLPTTELPPLLLKPIDPDQLVNVLEMKLSGDLENFSANPSAYN